MERAYLSSSVRSREALSCVQFVATVEPRSVRDFPEFSSPVTARNASIL